MFITTFSYVYSLNFCCCLYSKDQFRGFGYEGYKTLFIDTTGLDKADVGNKMMKLCYDGQKGFPSIENINRLKKINLKTCDNENYYEDKKCESECNNLMKDFNEKFYTKQEENREAEAKILRERRAHLQKILDNNIKTNFNNFHSGKACSISVLTKYKDKNTIESLDGIVRPKGNSILTEDISFESITEIELLKEERNNQEEVEIPETIRRGSMESEINLKIEKLEQANIDLDKEIHKLDSDIMCLARKKKKPIDYIFDRFNIQDDILVKIIKIFENSLDDVVRMMKHYFDDTVYFQFRIADKLNKIQNSKLELKKI
jgi:hypothetical protein